MDISEILNKYKDNEVKEESSPLVPAEEENTSDVVNEPEMVAEESDKVMNTPNKEFDTWLGGITGKVFQYIKDNFVVPNSTFKFKDENIFYNMIRNIVKNQHILVTGPTGCGKSHLGKILAKEMGMNFYSINLGDTSNPASKLLGHISYDPDSGTKFVRSKFVEMIQSEEPTLIMLDEITRDRSQELQNILIPVLDEQKVLILDEENPPVEIKISDKVRFYATANVGRQYIGASNTIDRAWLDRFTGGFYPLAYLDEESEAALLCERTEIDKDTAAKITLFASKVRALANSDELTTSVSTRMTLSTADAVSDGVDLLDALMNITLPYYNDPTEKDKVLNIIEAM